MESKTPIRGTAEELDWRVRAAEWVAGELVGMDECPAYLLASLKSDPNREEWFQVILPALDYEIKGGTWEKPLWAFTEHPWFTALGLTNEECEAALQESE